MKKVIKTLDLTSWDNWLPLAVIAAFAILGAMVSSGIVAVRIPPGDADRIHTVYTEIGIQTTAGVFAVIISLSLVAIQFAAQEYSHRIMDYYIKSVMFWSTLVVYLGVMVVGIVLQTIATEAENIRVAGVIMVGSILALVMLIPHFLITASYLKPEFIITKLLRRVDREYLLGVGEYLSTKKQAVSPHSDRLLPVVEIVERSIDRGDITTIRGALERIYQMYERDILPMKSSTLERHLLEHVLRIGRRAIAETDEPQAQVMVIRLLGDIGASGPAVLAVEELDELGFAAVQANSDPASHQMIDSFHAIFEATSSEEARKGVLNSYRDLIAPLASRNEERLLRHLAEKLTQMAQAAVAKRDTATWTRCLQLLESAGHDAAVNNILDVVLQVAQALQAIAIAVAAEDVDKADGIVRILLRVERAINPNERETIAATEFARVEIERAIAKARPVAAPAAAGAEVQGSGVDTAELWGKPADGEAKAQPQPAGSGPDLSDLWSKPAEGEAKAQTPAKAQTQAKEGSPDFSDLWSKPQE